MRPKKPTPISRLIPDAAPEVLRAHTIADTIRALCNAGALDGPLQPEQRDAIAEELGVPALWIDAAQNTTRLNLDLLNEWREWAEALMPRKAVA